MRNSHCRCFIKKGVLRNFVKFPGKYLYQSLFFNKVAGIRPATLLKKRLWHRCFLVIFTKFLRISFLQNTSGRLLLIKCNFNLSTMLFRVKIQQKSFYNYLKQNYRASRGVIHALTPYFLRLNESPYIVRLNLIQARGTHKTLLRFDLANHENV